MIPGWLWMERRTDCTSTITKQAMDYILPGGWLLYEIGWDQGKAVKELLDKEGFINTEIKRDLCGLDRVVLGQKSLQEEQNV